MNELVHAKSPGKYAYVAQSCQCGGNAAEYSVTV